MEQELFKIVSPHKPTGDQPEAIKKLVSGINEGKKLLKINYKNAIT